MVSPVIYDVSILKTAPEWVQNAYFLNPMAGAIDGFKWCLTGVGEFRDVYLWSALMAVFLFVSGLYIFKRMEYKMADLV